MSHTELNQPSSEEEILSAQGYNFLKQLGEGSYAKVYLAEYEPETECDRKMLACKIIDTSKASKEFTNKFLPRELNILTKLNHPYIVHIHCIFKRCTKYYIFMSFAENGDLLSYVYNTKSLIPESQARIWLRQLILAIQYINEMDIVHRDIKCENVLLTSDFNVQLADFGLARYVVDNRGKRVLSDTYCGSLMYAAPEIVRSTPYNPKISDMWSLGVLLFIILNKAMPFNDTNIKYMYEQQINRRFKFRTKVVNTLSYQVKKLITHLLEPDVSKRWKLEQIMHCDWFAMDSHLTVMTASEQSALNNAIEERKKNDKKFNEMKNIKYYMNIEEKNKLEFNDIEEETKFNAVAIIYKEAPQKHVAVEGKKKIKHDDEKMMKENVKVSQVKNIQEETFKQLNKLAILSKEELIEIKSPKINYPSIIDNTEKDVNDNIIKFNM